MKADKQDVQSIGEYILYRLQQHGVQHFFGVPGDYILGFYDLATRSAIQHIGTTREDTAAFAADGYARCHGLGCVVVTYGVGALNLVNPVAGAFAESSPVIVISGAPGVDEQQNDPLIHHKFGPFNFQKEIFERITCHTEVLTDPLIAFRQVDRAIQKALQHSQPVYLELPRDRIHTPGMPFTPDAGVLPQSAEPGSDPQALEEAVGETLALLEQAQSPAILAGVELHRASIQHAAVDLVEKLNIPVASTLTGKSVVGERHPAYLGVYEGAMGSVVAKQTIENADLALILGVRFNDVDLGIYTARLDPYRIVRASHDDVFIRHHRYQHVRLVDFITSLSAQVTPRSRPVVAQSPGASAEDFPRAGRPISVERMIGRINTLLTPELTVVCDVGDCLFAAIDLRVHKRNQFLASAYYTSMGFAVPAALGVHCASSQHRCLVLVGDGAFQMTGTELSTLVRFGFNPVVIVLNNAGYSTERFILEGPFNDIMTWHFHELGRVFGPLQGYEIHNEQEFDSALRSALAETESASILNVHLRKDEASPAMRRLADHLSNKI